MRRCLTCTRTSNHGGVTSQRVYLSNAVSVLRDSVFRIEMVCFLCLCVSCSFRCNVFRGVASRNLSLAMLFARAPSPLESFSLCFCFSLALATTCPSSPPPLFPALRCRSLQDTDKRELHIGFISELPPPQHGSKTMEQRWPRMWSDTFSRTRQISIRPSAASSAPGTRSTSKLLHKFS